ncbi:accessory Sec system protein Asp1 [Limosilactobacillus balticus]|uniref:accessory Sec system protein Asp1 n=1 Tax=Limosilactobacillus balticus TaxID=2759747 RepID=UPI001E647E31|nr:accessory Sec system protein Asp1 [Limosilactobacillus balticus]MCD7131460.1 accessory Sec system protein Asp1 [Limosilactobacillus balticus]
MDYLVPAWHELSEDWAHTIPKLEFDDAVSHIKVFQTNQKPFSLIITDYQPQLSTKLNQLTISPTQIFSTFDYLQGVNHIDSQIVDYRDFNWPSGAYYNFTNFRVIVMVKENPYAKVIFDTQGKILWVDYLENDKLSRRLLLDSRGFISREELFENGQPYQYIYYDEQGYWRFKHDVKSDQVEINKRFSELTNHLHYEHLNDLLTEVVIKQVLSKFNVDRDNLIVTMDDQAVIDPKTYSSYQPIFSLSRWHTYRESLDALKNQELILVADNNETKNNIKKQTNIDATIIPLFQSRFNLGHSQRSDQERIGLFIESMAKDEIDKVLELLYQRLLKNPKTTALTVMSYSTEKFQQAQQALENLKKTHQGEFILASEEQNEVEELLTKQIDIPKLTIDTKRISTPAEAGRQLDSLRILIDWGNQLDEFLQISAISTGIPQLYRQTNDQVKDYQNGLICPKISDINKGLDYYLGSLKHWNEALIYNIQLMNQLSAAELQKKWEKVLTK